MESASFRLAVRAFLMHAVPQRLVLARTDTGSREGRGAATRKRGAREQDVRSETPCVGRFIVTGAGLTAVLQPVDVRVAAQCFRKPPGARVRHAPEAEGGREDAATGGDRMTVTRARPYVQPWRPAKPGPGCGQGSRGSLLDSVLDHVSEALVRGEDVRNSNFGSFRLRDKPTRPGRNPKTGSRRRSVDAGSSRFRRAARSGCGWRPGTAPLMPRRVPREGGQSQLRVGASREREGARASSRGAMTP